jgi:hypothetical protein
VEQEINPARKVAVQAVQGAKNFSDTRPKYTSHNNRNQNSLKDYSDRDMTFMPF